MSEAVELCCPRCGPLAIWGYLNLSKLNNIKMLVPQWDYQHMCSVATCS